MMNNLDYIELYILIKLVNDRINKIQDSQELQDPQYEFDLRMLNHKLEVLRQGFERHE